MIPKAIKRGYVSLFTRYLLAMRDSSYVMCAASSAKT